MNMINGSNSTSRPRDLVDALVARGLIAPDAADLVRREAARIPGGSFVRAVEHMALVDEADLVSVLAAESRLGVWAGVDGGPDHPPLDAALGRRMTAEALVAAGTVPIAVTTGRLVLAMLDPDDLAAAETMRRRLGHGGGITGVVIGRTAFAGLIGHLHRGTELVDAMIRAATDRGHGDGLTMAAEAAASDDPFRDAHAPAAEESSITRLADGLITSAVRAGASDIHLDPAAGHMQLRLRIDGVLNAYRVLDASLALGLITRLKVLAGLDAVVTLQPQDGRFTTSADGLPVDIRIATHPTVHGEAAVLRLLDADRQLMQLGGLGLAPPVSAALARVVLRPDGIIVVAGPTGSGKSTTLRALVGAIDRRRLAVATLEDPVEYPLNGVRQTDLSRLPGLDFASGIRSLMRQDPDVLLIGEMRDEATAAMAYRAAITGHRVFTTLHAGDVLGVIDRLRDLRLSPVRLAGVLSAVVVQRLIRRVCPSCTDPVPRDPDAVGMKVRARPRGCPACGFQGFRGRIPVCELLVPDAAFEALLAEDAPRPRLAAALAAAGHRRLIDHARDLLAGGQTTRAEIEAVIGPLDA